MNTKVVRTLPFTNESEARQRAWEAWKNAVNAKAPAQTIARLKAELDVADAALRRAQGKS